VKRAVVALAFALLATVWLGSGTAAAAEPEWHSDAPVGELGVPAPLGEIGDIEFWAPNRGVLITGGIEGVTPAGVYAYDGTGWHLYSTVCGGSKGKIAWAGPDEFWTVADYATKQENASLLEEEARTLCHFQNGEVTASYAQPLGSPTVFQKMGAAACAGPSECWFGGAELPPTGPNLGAFHLYWNGSSLTALPSSAEAEGGVADPPGTVKGLDFFGGTLFENATAAPFIRTIALASPGIFTAVELPEGAHGPFVLAGDPGQLWAVSGNGESVLRDIGTGFEEIPIGEPVASVTTAASEPNGAGVWVSGSGPGNTATVSRIGAAGDVSSATTLPRPQEELSGKGGGTVMACPAAGQCWLATESGWLFHLGGPLPQDNDPAMHALITFRPTDESTRVFVPPGLPEDNSGETERAKSKSEEALEPFPEERPPSKLVYDVHQKLIGKRTLELTFKLRGRAHVQLRAKFHDKIVAKTPRLTLGKGPHRLRLKLDPQRWPTGLDFEVHPAPKPKK
jgi:hypothetical protein